MSRESGLMPLQMAFRCLSDAIGLEAALAVVQQEMGYQTMIDVPPDQRGEVACELIERARSVLPERTDP